MMHQRLRFIIFCSNDKPGLTLTILRQGLCNLGFYMETVTVMHSLGIIAACGVEFDLQSKLNGLNEGK